MADLAAFFPRPKNELAPLLTWSRIICFALDKMMPGALAQYRWKEGDFDTGAPDGDYYGLPADAQAQVFAYNKKMFDAAGVAYPTDDWTWDDLREAAIKLTDPAKEQFGFFMDQRGDRCRDSNGLSLPVHLFSRRYKIRHHSTGPPKLNLAGDLRWKEKPPWGRFKTWPTRFHGLRCQTLQHLVGHRINKALRANGMRRCPQTPEDGKRR